MVREDDLGVHSHLQVVTAKTGHILYDNPFYLACLNICNHPLKIGAVEISS